MEVKATLKPGQNGTKKLTDKYGQRLVCVRYRYDPAAGRRYTTVELIEQDAPWSIGQVAAQDPDPVPSQRIGVRVEYWENDLREQVKAAGGIWRPRQKLWEMRYADVVALGLEARIVGPEPGIS